MIVLSRQLPSFVILSSIVAGQLGHFYWVHYILEDDFKADSIGKLVLTLNLLIIMTVAWEVVRWRIARFERDVVNLFFNF